MTTHIFTHSALTLAFAALLPAPAFTQMPSAVLPLASTVTPAAYVYVQAAKGVNVYSVNAAGKPTLVKGSPIPVIGAMEDVNGKYLISVGTTWLHSYLIESTGALGKQVGTINTQDYGGSQCGTTEGTGSVLDHSGKYLYVSLFLPANDETSGCGVWQSYQVESDGHFKYLGYDESFGSPQGFAAPDGIPTVSSNDKFAYATQPSFEDGNYTSFTGFKIASNGELEALLSFASSDPPTPDGSWFYYPSGVAADNAGHLAAVLNWFVHGGAPQLASYTIESNGSVVSTNTWEDMPAVNLGAAISMSWSGKLLAVNQNPGLQIFHFNGSAPITPFRSLLLPATYIGPMAWDKNNHLYLLAGRGMYVYTVTPTSISEVSGSPFPMASGSGMMIVVPK